MYPVGRRRTNATELFNPFYNTQKARECLERICPYGPHPTEYWCNLCWERNENLFNPWHGYRPLSRQQFVIFSCLSRECDYKKCDGVKFILDYLDEWDTEFFLDQINDCRQFNLGYALPGPRQWSDELGGSLGLPKDLAKFILDYCLFT